MENSSAALDIHAAPDHGGVPRKRVSMRKTREILRLRHELKLSQRQIAAAANLSQTAVLSCLKRFELPDGTTDDALDAALYRQNARSPTFVGVELEVFLGRDDLLPGRQARLVLR